MVELFSIMPASGRLLVGFDDLIIEIVETLANGTLEEGKHGIAIRGQRWAGKTSLLNAVEQYLREDPSIYVKKLDFSDRANQPSGTILRHLEETVTFIRNDEIPEYEEQRRIIFIIDEFDLLTDLDFYRQFYNSFKFKADIYWLVTFVRVPTREEKDFFYIKSLNNFEFAVIDEVITRHLEHYTQEQENKRPVEFNVAVREKIQRWTGGLIGFVIALCKDIFEACQNSESNMTPDDILPDRLPDSCFEGTFGQLYKVCRFIWLEEYLSPVQRAVLQYTADSYDQTVLNPYDVYTIVAAYRQLKDMQILDIPRTRSERNLSDFELLQTLLQNKEIDFQNQIFKVFIKYCLTNLPKAHDFERGNPRIDVAHDELQQAWEAVRYRFSSISARDEEKSYKRVPPTHTQLRNGEDYVQKARQLLADYRKKTPDDSTDWRYPHLKLEADVLEQWIKLLNQEAGVTPASIHNLFASAYRDSEYAYHGDGRRFSVELLRLHIARQMRYDYLLETLRLLRDSRELNTEPLYSAYRDFLLDYIEENEPDGRLSDDEIEIFGDKLLPADCIDFLEHLPIKRNEFLSDKIYDYYMSKM